MKKIPTDEQLAKDRARSRAYYATNREQILARSKANYDRDPEPKRAKSREESRRLRSEMLDAYGRQCACCGETEETFLCLDHEGGGGEAERLALSGRPWSNIPVLRRLRRDGWPTKGYRILCANCNMATMRGRTCPHQTQAGEKSA